MELDPILLARIQFAFTVSFHIIFPSFTIGLAAYIATLEFLWMWTGRDHFRRISRFWIKIFAVSFGMGVVSGIVLSYQFGTNWSRFSVAAGNVIGPLMGYEVLTAFFLEATFLGVLLFGEKRVPRWLHFMSAVIVAIGTATSAFWILSANSWMHTPVGHEIRDGIAYPVDWWQIVFNPSFPYRFAHMLNAAYLTTAFCVLAVGARYLLANRHEEEARTMVRMAIGLLAILAPAQLVIGDLHGLNTLEHQPIKIAAMEGHWDGSKPGDFHILAWPDEKEGRNLFAISIPRGSSLVLTHDPNGLFPGLTSVPPEDRPPVWSVFYAFRMMLAVGFTMIFVGLFGLWLWYRGSLFTTRWFLTIPARLWWLGFAGVLSGWLVTESGRQPWLVQGILRTADAVSPISAGTVAFSLAMFVIVYGIVFFFGMWFINRLINRGPQGALTEEEPGLPNRPLSGANKAGQDVLQGST